MQHLYLVRGFLTSVAILGGGAQHEGFEYSRHKELVQQMQTHMLGVEGILSPCIVRMVVTWYTPLPSSMSTCDMVLFVCIFGVGRPRGCPDLHAVHF